MKSTYTWVSIPGGIVRFETAEIEEFNKKFKSLSKHVENLDYWNYFSWYFAEELDDRPAYGFWSVY